MSTGIDIYTKYQTVRDWSAVRRAGYAFAYVKVSDGTSDRDAGGHGPAGRRAGLAMGGYHYAQPGDPVAQANRLVDRCAAAGLLDLAPALDIEAPFVPGSAAERFAVKFCQQVARRGHRPCIYGSDSMLRVILPAVRRAVPSVLVWVARYGARPTVTFDVWQHSSSGQVPGITASAVDLNTGAVPLNTSIRTGGPLMALTDKQQQELLDKVDALHSALFYGGVSGAGPNAAAKTSLIDRVAKLQASQDFDTKRQAEAIIAGMYSGGPSTPDGKSMFEMLSEIHAELEQLRGATS